jgi:hypothetical protein
MSLQVRLFAKLLMRKKFSYMGKNSLGTFFFGESGRWWYWGLNSGVCTGQVGALTLDLYL